MSKGMFGALERKLGLPPIDEVAKLTSGESGKRIDSVLRRLERLSRNGEALQSAIELLNLVRELDEKGTLARLDGLLKDLLPLTRSKMGKDLVGKIDKLTTALEALTKEG